MADYSENSADLEEKYIAIKDKPVDLEEIIHENNRFKPKIFFEFLFYFILNALFGPLSIFILRFLEDGDTLARNLHIYGGKDMCYRFFIWLTKVYCIVATFTLANRVGIGITADMIQFYLMAYTELSLAVLFAAYYSSFTLREIRRIKSDPSFYDDDANLLEKLLKIGEDSKSNFFDKKRLNLNFPEIDLDLFYFVYPTDYDSKLPPELNRVELNQEDRISYYPVSRFALIDGVSYSKNILRKVEYAKLNFRRLLWWCKLISRFVVMLRIVFPIIEAVYEAIEANLSDFGWLNGLYTSLFLLEELGYSILIYRFCIIFDVLLVGILLYFQKMNILSILENTITEEVIEKGEQQVPKIDMLIPQNIQNWFHVRKLLSSVNEQMLVIVDVNMSYIVIFILVVFLFYLIGAFGILQNVTPIKAVINSFSGNPTLVLMTTYYILSLLILLFISLVIGMVINFSFQYNINLLTTFQFRIKNMNYFAPHYNIVKVKAEINKMSNKYDVYVKYMERLKEYLGPEDFANRYGLLMQALDNELTNVIAQVNYEATQNPHKILGVPTQPSLLVQLSGLVSVIGVSTINSLIGGTSSSSSSSSSNGGSSSG